MHSAVNTTLGVMVFWGRESLSRPLGRARRGMSGVGGGGHAKTDLRASLSTGSER